LLGWSPGGDREIMTKDEMISLFNIDGLQRKAAIFDPQKLEWMNGQHLSRTSSDVLATIIGSGGSTIGISPSGTATVIPRNVLDLLKVRARRIGDIEKQAGPYVSDDPIAYDPEAVEKNWKDRGATAEMLEASHGALETIPSHEWTLEKLEATLRNLAENRGTTAGKVFQALRVALTGFSVSPGIFEILVVQGRERALGHIRNAVAWLTGKA
jgi:glutamyl/glutaminyl-tRNA synthetase